MNKLDGPEKFVIDILKDESVIEKTLILWKIDKYSTTVYELQGLIENWKYLEQYLVHNEVAANQNIGSKHWLKELFSTALEVSTLMMSPYERKRVQ